MKSLSFILALLFISACAVPKNTVPLGAGVRFPLLEVNQVPSQVYLQDFEIITNGEPFRFNGLVELEPGRIAMVGLTPIGNRGFSILWENDEMSFEHMPFYRLPIEPSLLLAAWQMTFLEKEQLTVALEQAGMDQTSRDDWLQLSTRGIHLASIRHGEDRHRFKSLQRGFTLNITTRSIEPL